MALEVSLLFGILSFSDGDVEEDDDDDEACLSLSVGFLTAGIPGVGATPLAFIVVAAVVAVVVPEVGFAAIFDV